MLTQIFIYIKVAIYILVHIRMTEHISAIHSLLSELQGQLYIYTATQFTASTQSVEI